MAPSDTRTTRAQIGRPFAASSDAPKGHLHRVIVEIRDAMIDPSITFDIGADDRDLLERAERHLVGNDMAVAMTLHVPNIDERVA